MRDALDSLGHDYDVAEAKIAASKLTTRTSLQSKLEQLYNPTLETLEQEGVVEEGWFEQAADQGAAGSAQ